MVQLAKLAVFLHALSVAQATGSYADGPVPYKDQPITVTIGAAPFTTQALNASKTIDAVKVKGFRYLTFGAQYVFGAASAVTMSCQDSDDSTTWYDIHVLNLMSPPTAVSAPMIWSYAAGASKNWDWAVPIRRVYARCTFAGTGATSSDTLTLTARAGFY